MEWIAWRHGPDHLWPGLECGGEAPGSSPGRKGGKAGEREKDVQTDSFSRILVSTDYGDLDPKQPFIQLEDYDSLNS